MKQWLIAIAGVICASIGVFISILKGKLKKTEEKIITLEKTIEEKEKSEELACKAIKEMKNLMQNNNKIEEETEKAKNEGEEGYISYIDSWNNGN